MGKVRVKSNKLPAVVRALKTEFVREMRDSTTDLSNDIEPKLRHRTGLTQATVRAEFYGAYSAAVLVGSKGGAAFYVQFDEFGTHRPNAFGVVFPARHEVERTGEAFIAAFASHIAEGVRRAANAG